MVSKFSKGAIAGIVIGVIIGTFFLFCFCVGCCSACAEGRKEAKKDIENSPYNYDKTKKVNSNTSKTTKTVQKPSTISPPLLAPPPSTTPAPITLPARVDSTTNRPDPPVKSNTYTNRYQPLRNSRDSVDLPERTNAWNTYRPPTPPLDNHVSYRSISGLDRATSIPELRGLRRLSSPPILTGQEAPLLPPTAITVNTPPPLSPLYNSSNLGMHDEGPSRKPTPHFSVPITRPQTAATITSSSNLGETSDSIPMTEISRTGTRSFTPKVRALKRLEPSNSLKKSGSGSGSGSRRKSKNKKIVEEAEVEKTPRKLITNDEGLTAAQLARNLPRKGFVPKVAATTVVKDDMEDVSLS